MKKLGWFIGPVGLPDSVKKVLIPALEKSIKSPDVVNTVRQLGAIEDFVPGEEFKKMMTDEYEMAMKLLKTASPPSK